MSWTLNDYKPEPLKDDAGFEAFGGKYDVTVAEVKFDHVEAGERDGEAYEAYDRMKLVMEVSNAYKTEHSVNLGRKLFRSVNIDSPEAVKKLLNITASVNVVFTSKEELERNCKGLVGKNLSVSCWKDKSGRQAFQFIKPGEPIAKGNTGNVPF